MPQTPENTTDEPVETGSDRPTESRTAPAGSARQAGLGTALAAGVASFLGLCVVETGLSTALNQFPAEFVIQPTWFTVAGIYAATGLVFGVALRVAAGIARRLRPHTDRGGWIGAGALLTPPAILAAFWVNRRLLPTSLDPVSIAGNLAMLAACIGAWWFLAARLSRSGAGTRSRLARAFGGVTAGAAVVIGILCLVVPGAARADTVVGEAAADDAPSVLLITMDTTRADALGCYAADLDTPSAEAAARLANTPNLDALAADGVRFRDCWTPVPVTDPSHATILTGRYPQRHGLWRNGWRLPQRERTAAEVLRDAGYRTAAAVSVDHLGREFGFDQGVQDFHANAWTDRFYNYGRHTHRYAFVLAYPFVSHYIRDVFGTDFTLHERPADSTTDDAVAWLESNGDQRFFLWVHYFDPHSPYAPPAEQARAYADADVHVPPESLEPDEAVAWRRGYHGEVAFMDRQIGRLFDAIRSAGAWDDTLVIATADHGELLGEHNLRGHDVALYREATRVPLIVRGPGIPAGGVRDDVVSTADLFPTVVARAGLDPGDVRTAAGREVRLDGRDLGPLLAGERPADWMDRPVFQELSSWRGVHIRGVREGRLHWLNNLLIWGNEPEVARELYDVVDDPLQHHNLLTETDEPPPSAERLAELSAAFHGLFGDLTAQELSPEARRMMKALGYIDE